jgi:hypothetical protein
MTVVTAPSELVLIVVVEPSALRTVTGAGVVAVGEVVCVELAGVTTVVIVPFELVVMVVVEPSGLSTVCTVWVAADDDEDEPPALS